MIKIFSLKIIINYILIYKIFWIILYIIRIFFDIIDYKLYIYMIFSKLKDNQLQLGFLMNILHHNIYYMNYNDVFRKLINYLNLNLSNIYIIKLIYKYFLL